MTIQRPRSERWWWRICGVYALISFVGVLVFPFRGLRTIVDYNFFDPLVAARILRSGSQCIYCPAVQQSVASSWIHQPVSYPVSQYLDPPPVAFVLQPVAALSPNAALVIMFVVMFVCLGIAGWLLVDKVMPAEFSLSRRTTIVAMALFVTSSNDLWVGQWTPLLLLPAVLAVLRARRGGFFSAGLLLSVLFLKVQLLWLTPIILLGARQWRLVAGVATGGIVWLVATILILGPQHFSDWTNAIHGSLNDDPVVSLGIPGVVANLTHSSAIANWSLAVLAVLVLLASAFWGSKLAGKADVAICIGIVVSVACSPHIFSYDLIVLALPLSLLAGAYPFRVTALAIAQRALSVASLIVGSLGPLHASVVTMVVIAGCLLMFSRRSAAANSGPSHIAIVV